MVPSREKFPGFDKTGVPWHNVVAFVGHTLPQDASLYESIHGKGTSCMAGTSRNLDRQFIGKQVTDIRLLERDYRALLRRGADLIETDLPSQVGQMLCGASPVPFSKKSYFR
jgi:glycerophosphoryl diester phosphodiesterase